MPARKQHDEKDTMAVIPWFRRDWKASKARAYVVATGDFLAGWCYRELLDAHWDETDCALQNEDVELASLAGVSLDQWLSVRDRVLSWFTRTADGKLRSPRAHFEWKKARHNRSAQRKRQRAAAKSRWQKEKDTDAERMPRHSHGSAAAMPEECPPTPSPSPSPTPSPNNKPVGKAVDVPSGGGTRPPANPLLAMRPGGRPALESEGWGLVREIHALEPNRDPEDIVAEASAFKGADRTKLNLNTMSDDRLLNTVRDLRHMLDRLRKQAAAPQAQMSQYERLKAKRAAEGDER